MPIFSFCNVWFFHQRKLRVHALRKICVCVRVAADVVEPTVRDRQIVARAATCPENWDRVLFVGAFHARCSVEIFRITAYFLDRKGVWRWPTDCLTSHNKLEIFYCRVYVQDLFGAEPFGGGLVHIRIVNDKKLSYHDIGASFILLDVKKEALIGIPQWDDSFLQKFGSSIELFQNLIKFERKTVEDPNVWLISHDDNVIPSETIVNRLVIVEAGNLWLAQIPT